MSTILSTPGLAKGLYAKKIASPVTAKPSGTAEASAAPGQSEKLGNAQTALDRMKEAKTNHAAVRKQAARDAIDRIKQKLQVVKMFGGDPKLVARQVAQLARELRAAVKDYAAAGGQADGQGGTETSAAVSQTAAGAADPTGIAATQGAAPSAAVGTTETAAAAEAAPAATGPAAGSSPAASMGPEPTAKTAEAAAPAAAGSEDRITGRERTGHNAEKDQDLAEIRQLVIKLRTTLEKAKRDVGGQANADGRSVAQSAKAADQALKEIDELVRDLSSEGTKTGPISVLV